MNIFLAGASGAVGRPLVRLLVGAGHAVVGSTRTEAGAAVLRGLGCAPAIVDVFDADGLARVAAAARPEAVIHMLTDLGGVTGGPPQEETLRRNARLRREGTANLVQAACVAGARRLVVQSIAWAYAPKTPPYRETDPLYLEAEGTRAITVREGVAPLEELALGQPDLVGVVLRYGQFYGPGTWSGTPTGASPVHVDAAAHAAFLAIDHGPSGIYNIADPGGEAVSDKAAAALGWRADFRF